MTTTNTAAKALSKKVSPAARARARSEKVIREAGSPGHIVSVVPRHSYRTDLVDPVLSFVVYGNPAPQGSKNIVHRGGKAVTKESSEALAPWRTAVRTMSRKAIDDWAKRHDRPWEPLDEAVMVSPTITMPATQASTKSGAVFHRGTPDLDKLLRALGDSISPVPLKPTDGKGLAAEAKAKVRDEMRAQRAARSILVEDSRIAAWGQPLKVYPNTIPTSLGYPGTLIQVWRMSELEKVGRRPVMSTAEGEYASAGDLRAWGRPGTGQSWEEAAAALWSDPAVVLSADGQPVELFGQALGEAAMRTVLAALALHGPEHRLRVVPARA